MNWLLVVLGAAIGAPLRYLTDRAVQRRHDSVFPWGTLAVNVLGCLVLGLVTGAVTAGAASSSVLLFVGTGLCGALTHVLHVRLRDAAAGGGRARRSMPPPMSWSVWSPVSARSSRASPSLRRCGREAVGANTHGVSSPGT